VNQSDIDTHSHAFTLHTHYLTGYVLRRSVVFAPYGLEVDRIRPLLGSVECFENSPTAQGCKVEQPHRWGCVVQLHQLGTLTHSHINYTLTGGI